MFLAPEYKYGDTVKREEYLEHSGAVMIWNWKRCRFAGVSLKDGSHTPDIVYCFRRRQHHTSSVSVQNFIIAGQPDATDYNTVFNRFVFNSDCGNYVYNLL